MRITLSIFVLLIICTFAQAQKSTLIFYNQQQSEAVQIRKGGLLILEYQGYLKQMELNSNYILDVNDSTITMGKPRVFSAPTNTKTIRLKDITGFRKISAGSMLLKTALTVGATLGTYYTIRANGDKLSSTQQILYSTGAGLIANISLKLIFPQNKIKYKTENGWEIMVR